MGKLKQKWMYTKYKWYLGLEIFAESPAGAKRVIEQRVSAALACTSGQSYINHVRWIA